MRTVQVDQRQQIARIQLDRPTLISEIQIGTLPTGEPAIPRLRILIEGHVVAESYWRTVPPLLDGGAFQQARYVYLGQKEDLPLLLPEGPIEFRVQARDQVALVPIEDWVDPLWRFARITDAGKTWQPIEGALPIKVRKL